MRHLRAISLAIAAALLPTVAAWGYVDLAGGWAQRFHEDLPERGAGPDIGDYLGLPLNDAARLRADSWDAAKWTMLERQCEPHPADYAPRGPASMRISSTFDPVSQDVVSWHTTMMWMLPHRTIYMDGRPRPSRWPSHPREHRFPSPSGPCRSHRSTGCTTSGRAFPGCE